MRYPSGAINFAFLIVYYFNPVEQHTAGSLNIAGSFFYSLRIMEKKVSFFRPLKNRFKRN